MGRSLKKGPFADDHLVKQGGGAEREEREEGGQDLVAALDDPAGVRRAHASPCTTARSSSRCMSPKTWWATSWASSRRRGPSRDTRRRAARRQKPAQAGIEESRRSMEARAEARYVRVSPQKARLVVDLIRGQKAGEAHRRSCGPPTSGSRRRWRRCCGRRSPTRENRSDRRGCGQAGGDARPT